tara:strand:- start:163 stop:390 length:228 start_codon:yes stop_codon:yes gene_type:complete
MAILLNFNCKVFTVVGFPKIMIEEKGLIVLFEKHSTGTVIQGKAYGLNTGYHSTIWDMTNFEDYDGEVTLKNKKI